MSLLGVGTLEGQLLVMVFGATLPLIHPMTMALPLTMDTREWLMIGLGMRQGLQNIVNNRRK